MKLWKFIGILSLSLLLITAIFWLFGNQVVSLLGIHGELIQSIDSSLAVISFLATFFSILSTYIYKKRKNIVPIQTEDMNITSGDGSIVVGRDIINSVVLISASTDTKTDLTLENIEKVKQEYCKSIADRYKYISMKGLDSGEGLPLQINLKDIYVPLKARRVTLDGDIQSHASKTTSIRKVTPQPNKRYNTEAYTEPELVTNILKDSSGLIVLGDPGSGKSTLLKYLCLLLASSNGKDINMENKIPVLLSLGDYADEIYKNEDIQLIDFVSMQFSKHTTLDSKDFSKSLITSGQLLILLDGVDEVKNLDSRNAVMERIASFYTTYKAKGNKFIVTSRIIGYSSVRTLVDEMVECTLAEFDDDQIKEFIYKWSSFIYRHLKNTSEEEEKSEANQIMEAIRAKESIHHLARNPLLLTILSLIKRNMVILPERRVQLYDRYITILLSSWEKVRRISGKSTGPVVNDIKAKRILAQLALWVHEEGSIVKAPDIHRKLTELYSLQNDTDPENTASQFLSDIRENTALLFERGPDKFGFIHMALKEYLTATAIALSAQGNPEIAINMLSSHIEDESWHEIIFLTVSYIGIQQNLPEIASQIVIGLANANSILQAESITLAGEAALDAYPDGINLQCYDYIVEKLINIMEDEKIKLHLRHKAGIILARLGWMPKDLEDFIEIQPGVFLYGNEKQMTQIDYKYWISKYPITNYQYGKFIKDGGYDNETLWSTEGWHWRNGISDKNLNKEEKRWINARTVKQRSYPAYWDNLEYRSPLQPVVGVCWFEAEAFCNWYQTQIRENQIINIPRNYHVMLPTELEWEYAARGQDGKNNPWEGTFDINKTNMGETSGRSIGLTAVCTFATGVSVFGVYDMAGNVWEWTNSMYDNSRRVLRGGSSWLENSRHTNSCTVRGRFPQVGYDLDIGFRLALSNKTGL